MELQSLVIWSVTGKILVFVFMPFSSSQSRLSLKSILYFFLLVIWPTQMGWVSQEVVNLLMFMADHQRPPWEVWTWTYPGYPNYRGWKSLKTHVWNVSWNKLDTVTEIMRKYERRIWKSIILASSIVQIWGHCMNLSLSFVSSFSISMLWTKYHDKEN